MSDRGDGLGRELVDRRRPRIPRRPTGEPGEVRIPLCVDRPVRSEQGAQRELVHHHHDDRRARPNGDVRSGGVVGGQRNGRNKREQPDQRQGELRPTGTTGTPATGDTRPPPAPPARSGGAAPRRAGCRAGGRTAAPRGSRSTRSPRCAGRRQASARRATGAPRSRRPRGADERDEQTRRRPRPGASTRAPPGTPGFPSTSRTPAG